MFDYFVILALKGLIRILTSVKFIRRNPFPLDIHRKVLIISEDFNFVRVGGRAYVALNRISTMELSCKNS